MVNYTDQQDRLSLLHTMQHLVNELEVSIDLLPDTAGPNTILAPQAHVTIDIPRPYHNANMITITMYIRITQYISSVYPLIYRIAQFIDGRKY